MNIQRGEPEQSGDFAASWRELKWKLRIERLVSFVGIVSMQLTLTIGHERRWWLILVGYGAGALAVHLAMCFIKTFRCPRCGHKFYGPKSHPGIGPHAAKSCSNCELLLWSGDKP